MPALTFQDTDFTAGLLSQTDKSVSSVISAYFLMSN